MKRLAPAIVLLCVTAPQAEGSIRLLHGQRWCLSSEAVQGCGEGRGFPNPVMRGAVSPDGRSIYLPGGRDTTVGILRRDRATGAIRQEAGQRGCVSAGGARERTCTLADGFAGTTQDVVVSPDGRNVYVATGDEDGDRTSIITFARQSDGRLARLRGPAGCVASATLPVCTVQPGLTAYDLSITPDGAHLYAGGGPSLSAFARDASTGALIAAGEPAPIAAEAPVWSGDGRLGFGAGGDGDRVLAFTRDPASGALTLAPGACVSAKRVAGCRHEPRFERAGYIFSIAVAPDDTVYVSAGPKGYVIPPARGVPFALVAFKVARAPGVLVALPAGCRHVRRIRGCRQERRLANLHAMQVSPNGRHLYAASHDRIREFARDPRSGRLRRGARVRICDAPGPCSAGRAPVGGETGLLLSPDGRQLYAVGAGDHYATNGTIAALAVRPARRPRPTSSSR